MDWLKLTNKQTKNPQKHLLKVCTLRFKVNTNSRLAPTLEPYSCADVAEIIFRSEILVPELLLKRCCFLACAQHICHGDGDILNPCKGTKLFGELRLGWITLGG